MLVFLDKEIPGSIFRPQFAYCVPRDKARLQPLIDGRYFRIIDPGWSPDDPSFWP